MAILGFILGSFIDNYQRVMDQAKRQGGARISPEDVFQYYQQRTTINDVATMLMALSASVMKADGKVLKAELDFVKTFCSHQFGPRFNRENLQTLKRFLDTPNIPLDQICRDITLRMAPEVRLQLIHYLFQHRLLLSHQHQHYHLQ